MREQENEVTSFLESETLQEKLKERDIHRKRRDNKERDRIKNVKRKERKKLSQTKRIIEMKNQKKAVKYREY